MDPRFFLPCFHGPRTSRLGHKRKEKTRSITCRTDRANEANKRYLLLCTVVTVVVIITIMMMTMMVTMSPSLVFLLKGGSKGVERVTSHAPLILS